jgi:hypothetical protein
LQGVPSRLDPATIGVASGRQGWFSALRARHCRHTRQVTVGGSRGKTRATPDAGSDARASVA